MMHAFKHISRQALLRGASKAPQFPEFASIDAVKQLAGTARRIALPLFSVQTRTAFQMHVNKDWRPNVSFPQTPEEHVMRAHWYGMHPADYRINTDDQGERPMGDYPDLPIISDDEKDPYEPWDYPFHKFNFNEPMLHEWENYSDMRLDNFIYSESPMYALFVLWGAVTAFLTLIYLSRNYDHWFPLMAKSFPHNNQWTERGLDPRQEKQITAYTWEFDDEAH